MVQAKNRTEDQGLIACDVCLKEIPASGAKNEETSDYVLHFCGIDCYAKWKDPANPPVVEQESN